MEHEMMATAFWSGVFALMILCILGYGYARYRVDCLRQALFSLRDELFDYADAGNIGFTENAYGMLRSTINGFIRFSHMLSITGVVAIKLFERFQGPLPTGGFHGRWASEVARLDPSVRASMEHFMGRMHVLIVQHVLGKPGFWLLLVACRSKTAIDSVQERLIQKLDGVDESAFVCGRESSSDSSHDCLHGELMCGAR